MDLVEPRPDRAKCIVVVGPPACGKTRLAVTLRDLWQRRNEASEEGKAGVGRRERFRYAEHDDRCRELITNTLRADGTETTDRLAPCECGAFELGRPGDVVVVCCQNGCCPGCFPVVDALCVGGTQRAAWIDDALDALELYDPSEGAVRDAVFATVRSVMATFPKTPRTDDAVFAVFARAQPLPISFVRAR